MILTLRPKENRPRQVEGEWRSWFAWFPVYMNYQYENQAGNVGGTVRCIAWLTKVQRKFTVVGYDLPHRAWSYHLNGQD